ncbi:MAG: metal ABC transporter permease [Planctomyces sp.]|nr:metal ABC transporter permease [Planctomyces sp.]
MLGEILHNLRGWSEIDSAVALTAAMAAMSCALPGVWLVLRRHSMLGDALAHAALPGVVAAFLAAYGLRNAGWVPAERFDAVLQTAITLGAVGAGLLTAWLTEAIQRIGRIDSGAALGVVFTCLFAVGLVMIRMTADDVHIDPDCVLFGILEASVLDTINPRSWIPVAAVTNGAVLLANLALTLLFFKELRLAAFDPAQARTQGIPAGALHYLLLAATTVAAATAFSTVGSILVIGLLIVPAATAQLLTDRLWMVLVVSLMAAAAAAVLGQALAISVPGPVFSRLGLPEVRDAGTAGSIAVASGLLFAGAVFFGPRKGLVSQALDRLRVGQAMAADHLLGAAYREEEDLERSGRRRPSRLRERWIERLAGWRLMRRGWLIRESSGRLRLTDAGREHARTLVRSHRLWETWLNRNFPLPPDQLHLAADRAEHVLDPSLNEALAADLPRSDRDPHGRKIPGPPES